MQIFGNHVVNPGLYSAVYGEAWTKVTLLRGGIS